MFVNLFANIYHIFDYFYAVSTIIKAETIETNGTKGLILIPLDYNKHKNAENRLALHIRHNSAFVPI